MNNLTFFILLVHTPLREETEKQKKGEWKHKILFLMSSWVSFREAYKFTNNHNYTFTAVTIHQNIYIIKQNASFFQVMKLLNKSMA
jgi:hypothetical protein